VTLEKEDGTTLEIALKKLSKADQTIATDAAKGDGDNPFKPKTDDDPFKPKPSSPKDTPAEGASASAATRKVDVDWSQAESITLAATEKWQVTVGQAPDVFAAKPKTA